MGNAATVFEAGLNEILDKLRAMNEVKLSEQIEIEALAQDFLDSVHIILNNKPETGEPEPEHEDGDFEEDEDDLDLADEDTDEDVRDSLL